MGFYELGNGCDSCETVNTMLPSNLQMDPNTNMVSNMVMPSYNNQYKQNMQQQNMIMVPTTPMSSNSPQAMKQLNNNAVAVVVPNTNVTIPSPTPSKVIEGFTDTVFQNNKMWIVLGLVIFSALAANECCKYFLNKSLQLNDGNPLYYVAYVGVIILLTFAAYTYSTK